MPEVLRLIAEAMPDPVLMVGRSGRIVAVNEAAQGLFRWPRDSSDQVLLGEVLEVVGRPVAQLLHDGLATARPLPFRAVLYPIGQRPLTKRGECWRIAASDVPVAGVRFFEQSDPFLQFPALAETIARLNREVRARRRSEQRLQAALDRVSAACAVRDEFLAQVSHDLRTPLNAIIGMADFMRNEPFGPLAPKYREYVGDILESGQTLLDFVERMLKLSNMADEAQELSDVLSDLAHCMESCRIAVEPLAREKGLSLLIPQDIRLPGLRADQALVKQLLLNVLTNAVKYTPAGGQVCVHGLYLSEGGFELCVKDTGPGIPEGMLDEVMKPFTRLESPYARNTQGYGLGLPLARRAAEAMGADFDLAERTEGGTVVTIRFPPAVLQSSQSQ